VLHPFSRRAKAWEPHGLALRRHLHLRIDDVLDPYQLVGFVGLRLVALESVCKHLPKDLVRQLRERGAKSWSGGIHGRPLPDGTRICILNSCHNALRLKTTLMEEIAHIHLGHSPSGLLRSDDGLRMRSYDKQQEQDAYGVGAAALIPWGALFPSINKGASIEELAERYELSAEVVRYRIQITGAHTLYKSRQRTGR
jgi:IrrE N-terminal-like domain